MKTDGKIKKTALYLVLLLIWLSALFVVVFLSLTKQTSAHSAELPVYSVETDKKIASLTFNCAWDDTGLTELMHILESNNIRATFFVVGDFAEKYPDAVRMIYNAGHELGNHSMKHKDPVKMTYTELLRDIDECNKLLRSITGCDVSLYRVPSGSYNTDTITAAKSLGMTAVQWDTDSIDWKDITTEEIKNRIIKKADSGSIILFHVGKENTVEALPGIIEIMKNNGFSFVTVSELLPEGETYIDINGRLHKSEPSAITIPVTIQKND